MKPGLFGQSKLSFDEALDLVKSKKQIQVSDLGFDINHIGKEIECNYHESHTYENDYTHTYNLTILHAAIKYDCVDFVNELIKAGADKSIDMRVSYKHIGRNTNILASDGWTEWEIKKEEDTTYSTIDVAKGKNGILEILKNSAPVPH